MLRKARRYINIVVGTCIIILLGFMLYLSRPTSVPVNQELSSTQFIVNFISSDSKRAVTEDYHIIGKGIVINFEKAVPLPTKRDSLFVSTAGTESAKTSVMNESYNLNSGTPRNLISKIYDHLKQVESRPLWSSGETWSNDTFCYDFLLHTFDVAVPVCGGEFKPTDSIKCFGSRYDPVDMGTCVFENVAINPYHLSATKSLKRVNTSFEVNDTIVLLNDQNTSCPSPSADLFKKRNGDYQTKLIQHVVDNEQKSSSICKHWIDKVTFFFTAVKFHIYFRFLNYYNLHKSLWDHNVTSGDFLVLRISDNKNTRFPMETDRALFPEVISLQDLPNDTVCFKKVVTVPSCFSSVLFRCKMNPMIKPDCFSCNGTTLSGTPFETFRQRVLQGCSVNDDKVNMQAQFGIVSRTPYLRFPKDKPKKFKRVLTNENDVVERLRAAYPTANVSVLHPEQYDVCDQVRYAHKEDVLLGVHGAGMVHVWWLKSDALALELEPKNQTGNPTFRMLSILTGRRYKRVNVNGTEAQVSVDVNRVLNKIKANTCFSP